jgi:sn-glycerol 3-phosphate transport system substrate-binding protein
MDIQFWHSLGNQPGKVLTEIVEDFNKAHNETHVTLQNISPKDYASAAKDALSQPSEKRPHLVLAPEYLTGAMNKALKEGKLVSISDLLNPETLDDIAEIVKKTFGVDSLPFNPACGVLYYNKTLIEQAGVKTDWKSLSFEEFIAICEYVKKETGVSHGYTCAWPESYLIETALSQKNLSLLDPKGNYNFSRLKGHILHLRQLVKENVFLPPATGNYDPTRASFIEGKVAFYMQGSGHYSIIEEEAKKAGFEVGYAPLPVLSDGKPKVKYAFPLGGAAVWVFQKTQTEKKESPSPTAEKMVSGVREFLNYLASKEVQMKWHAETAYVPVRNSVPKELEKFYGNHPLHEAVILQTIKAQVGENSFGIKKENYASVRPKLYPLIRELLMFEGSDDEVARIIEEKLKTFDTENSTP